MFDTLEYVISGLIKVFTKLFILFFIVFATIAMFEFGIILIDLIITKYT